MFNLWKGHLFITFADKIWSLFGQRSEAPQPLFRKHFIKQKFGTFFQSKLERFSKVSLNVFTTKLSIDFLSYYLLRWYAIDLIL